MAESFQPRSSSRKTGANECPYEQVGQFRTPGGIGRCQKSGGGRVGVRRERPRGRRTLFTATPLPALRQLLFDSPHLSEKRAAEVMSAAVQAQHKVTRLGCGQQTLRRFSPGATPLSVKGYVTDSGPLKNTPIREIEPVRKGGADTPVTPVAVKYIDRNADLSARGGSNRAVLWAACEGQPLVSDGRATRAKAGHGAADRSARAGGDQRSCALENVGNPMLRTWADAPKLATWAGVRVKALDSLATWPSDRVTALCWHSDARRARLHRHCSKGR